jgi:hypothetical protein
MQEQDFTNDTTTVDHGGGDAAPATTPATVPAQQLVNPLEHYVKSEGGGSAFFEGDYLNFNGQSGTWTLGADKDPVDADAQFLCNIHEIHVGWIQFVKDGKPLREIGRIIDGHQRKPRKELGDSDEEDWPVKHGEPQDPWRMVTYLPMLMLGEGDNNDPVVYSPFSMTARKAVADLVDVYCRSERNGKFPVVKLGERNFLNKSGGTTYVPDFTIIGWEFWNGEPVPEVAPVPISPPAPAPTATASPAPAKAIAARKDLRGDMDDEIPFALAAMAAIPLLAMLSGLGGFFA